MSAKKNTDLFLELSDDLMDEMPTGMMDVSAIESAVDKTEVLSSDKTEILTDEDATAVNEIVSMPLASQKIESNLFEIDGARVAKERIDSIEAELERLRIENEELASAAETFKTKYDLLKASSSDSVLNYNSLKETVDEEKNMFLESLTAKDSEVEELRQKNEELEMRLVTSFKKVRVRERELENRLELLRAEGSALGRNKDETILDLKRQIDHMGIEIESFRVKNQKIVKKLMQKKELLRKVIKSLRIALTLAETDEAIEASRDANKDDTKEA